MSILDAITRVAPIAGIPLTGGNATPLLITRAQVLKKLLITVRMRFTVNVQPLGGLFDNFPMGILRNVTLVGTPRMGGRVVTFKAGSATAFWLKDWYRNKRRPFRSVPNTDAAATDRTCYFQFALDFSDSRMEHPGKSMLPAYLMSDLRLETTWGTGADLSATATDITVTELEAFVESVSVAGIEGDYAVNCETELLSTIAAGAGIVADPGTNLFADMPLDGRIKDMLFYLTGGFNDVGFGTMLTPNTLTILLNGNYTSRQDTYFRIADEGRRISEIEIGQGTFTETTVGATVVPLMNDITTVASPILPTAIDRAKGTCLLDYAPQGQEDALLDTRLLSSLQAFLTTTGAAFAQPLQISCLLQRFQSMGQ